MGNCKKGNNYIVDKENNIVKIELNRRNSENMWVIIDLEDLDKVINFPYTWYAKYSANAKGYYACATQYLPELKHGQHVMKYLQKVKTVQKYLICGID